jgi:CheY-like chemotaxis protein
MSGDLVSLRILVVSTSAPERDLLRQGGALASMPVDIVEAESASKAAAILSRTDVDIVFICGAFRRFATIGDRHSRAAAKPPLVVLMVSSPAQAVPAGAGAVPPDAVISKPVTAAEAHKIVDNCIRGSRPCRALVVDDSATMRSIVRKILAASRFKLEIAEASEGAAAVRHVREKACDMIFLDYNMPGLDGLATLAEIKRARPDVMVVIMTSAQDEAVADRARAAGATAFLKKPFYPADIDAVLHGYFGLTPVKRA